MRVGALHYKRMPYDGLANKVFAKGWGLKELNLPDGSANPEPGKLWGEGRARNIRAAGWAEPSSQHTGRGTPMKKHVVTISGIVQNVGNDSGYRCKLC